MIKTPVALGMIFCRSFRVDPVAGKTSLEGLFSSLRFRRFPTPPIPITVFTYLTDGAGEGVLRLEIQRLFANETPQWIWRQSRWFQFPDNPLLPVPVVFFTGNKFRVPAAGEYLIQLSADGEAITERMLLIHSED